MLSTSRVLDLLGNFVLFLLSLLEHLWIGCSVLIIQAVFQGVNAPLAPHTMNILWSSAIVLTAFAAWLKQARKTEKAEQALKDLPNPKAARVFIDEPVEHLLDLNREANEFRLLHLAVPFVGRWVRVSGRAIGVAESLSDDSLHLTVLLPKGESVNLQFSADRRECLRSLREGQPVSAIGEITNQILGPFILRNCELTGPQATVISTRPPIPFVTRSNRRAG